MNRKFNQVFFVFSLFLVSNIQAQQTGYYYKYDFNQYLRSKTTNPEAYKKVINDFLKYPTISRECGFELYLTYMLINHGTDSSEVFLIRKEQVGSNKNGKNMVLSDDLYSQYFHKSFAEADTKYLKRNSEKFFTEFTVLYEMEPYQNTAHFKDVDFTIRGKKVQRVMKTFD